MHLTKSTMSMDGATALASTFKSGYSTRAFNGLLHAVSVLNNHAAAKGSLKLYREGSTDVCFFKLAAPSTLRHEYYPRGNVMNTSATPSTNFQNYVPIPFADERIFITMSATSDWHAASTAQIGVTVYFEGAGHDY